MGALRWLFVVSAFLLALVTLPVWGPFMVADFISTWMRYRRQETRERLGSLELWRKQMTRGVQTGAELIAADRQRQVDVEGWTPEHDNDHEYEELAKASAAYLEAYLRMSSGVPFTMIPTCGPWPWGNEWWKPSPDPIRNLVKAGALIAAEIDRIHRAGDSK